MITRLAIIGTWFAALLSAPALAQCPSPLPPFLSFGIADEALHEHIVIPPATPGGETWQAKLRTQGGTDIYVQNVCLNPGFSSGWHLHPGFLVLTVAEGTVEWYDEDCVRHVYQQGDVFTEGASAHNVVNPGTVPARLTALWFIRMGAPRRTNVAPPACATQ